MATALIRPLLIRPLDEVGVPRKVTWLELFFDLVFVATVSQVAQPLGADLSLAGVGRFSLFFLLVWWAWLGQTTFATRFDSDDWLQRTLTLAQMFTVAVMGVNAGGALDGRDAAGFAAAYAVLRLLLVLHYLRAHQLRRARPLTTHYLIGCGAAAILWLASALVGSDVRYVLWAVAFALDVGTPLVAERNSHKLPPDESHLPERFGLFTIILLGECVLGVMDGMRHHEGWSLDAAVSALGGLTVIFLVWMWYFDRVDVVAKRVVRTPADARRQQLWTYAHVPFYLGLTVTGVGFERLIGVAAGGTLRRDEAALLGVAVFMMAAAMRVLSAAARSGERARQRPSTPKRRGAAWDSASQLRVVRDLVTVAAIFLVSGMGATTWPSIVTVTLVIAVALQSLGGGRLLHDSRECSTASESP